MYNNRLSARRGHFGLPSSFCLQMRRAHGSMFADDRPHTTRTARRHARIGGESVSLISRHKFARIARRNISDRISACSHGLSRLSRRTNIQFATQPYIPITHHLPRHPCPFSRTTIIYNTSTYAVYTAQCLAYRTLHHNTPHPIPPDTVHTARSYLSCLCCCTLPHPALHCLPHSPCEESSERWWGPCEEAFESSWFLPRIFERVITWVSLRHGVFPGDTPGPQE